MAAKKTVSVPGSTKVPLPHARVIAPAPADERLEVTIRLRPRTPLPNASGMLELSAAPLPLLTHEAYEEAYSASATDIARIRTFARQHNLTVARESAARRSVMLAGTVTDFNRAFQVKLQTYKYPGGTYRGRVGPVRIPADLADVVEGVFGLDNRPVVKRRAIMHRQPSASAADGAQGFTPDQLARIYDAPPGVDGTGQTIGIIELGGGYRPEDLAVYFKGLGIPAPTVIPVSVDGGANAPTTADSDDGEVALDIQVVGAVAPGAKIVVYFAPNDASAKGFLDALTKAVHDTENNLAVISISWGGPEAAAGNGFQVQFDQALQAAAMLGITVCVAAGDNGAADSGPKGWDGKAHVDFPSASPFALACGGTRLIAANGAIQAETVWNQHTADTSANAGQEGSFGSGGGGVSAAFPRPAYQATAGVPGSLNPKGFKGRGVPDVTGDGDPASGYKILVDGQSAQFGGTSAVAPLWAALIARINQKLNGRVGFINPQIYALPANSGAFRDITTGNNRVTFKTFMNVGYDAGSGWDACSGLGSPNGTVLSNLLSAGKPAPRKGLAATTRRTTKTKRSSKR